MPTPFTTSTQEDTVVNAPTVSGPTEAQRLENLRRSQERAAQLNAQIKSQEQGLYGYVPSGYEKTSEGTLRLKTETPKIETPKIETAPAVATPTTPPVTTVTPGTSIVGQAGTALDKATEEYRKATEAKAQQQQEADQKAKALQQEQEKAFAESAQKQKTEYEKTAQENLDMMNRQYNEQIQSAKARYDALSSNIARFGGTQFGPQTASAVQSAGNIINMASNHLNNLSLDQSIHADQAKRSIASTVDELERNIAKEVSPTILKSMSIYQDMMDRGLFDSPEAAQKKLQEEIQKISDTYNNSTLKNVEFAKAQMDMAMHAYDTALQGQEVGQVSPTGEMFNKFGQPIVTANGQPAVLPQGYKPTGSVQTDSDGKQYVLAQNLSTGKMEVQYIKGAPEIDIDNTAKNIALAIARKDPNANMLLSGQPDAVRNKVSEYLSKMPSAPIKIREGIYDPTTDTIYDEYQQYDPDTGKWVETKSPQFNATLQKIAQDKQMRMGIYSSDPSIQKESILSTIKKYADDAQTHGIQLVNNPDLIAHNIEVAIQAGVDPAMAMQEIFYKPFVSKPEYQELLRSRMQTADTTKWEQVGYDDNGKPIYGFVSTKERKVTPFGATTTSQVGTRADRNNNPLNMRVGGNTDSGGFTIFSTPEEGFAAAVRDIQGKVNGNSPAARGILGRNAQTLLDLIKVWAPSADNNDPTAYANRVAQELGVGINEPLKNLNVLSLARAMAIKGEGFKGAIDVRDDGTFKITPAGQPTTKTEAVQGVTEEQPSSKKVFTEDQINLMNRIGRAPITTTITKELEKKGLNITDISNYQAEKMKGKWMEGLDDNTINRINTTADNFDRTDVSKTFTKMMEAYETAKGFLNLHTASSNQALIYAYAKAMDPDSCVRSDEYSTVQQYAQTWGQKLGMDINRALMGEQFISEKAQKEMLETIESKYKSGRKVYENARDRQVERINNLAGKDIGNLALPSIAIDIQSDTKASKQKEEELTKMILSSIK